ncbi:MAG: hypothetical protein LBL33_08430 [Tannerella sp.]|jgi:hypothetical protein|nr:hypothetical protein [Tannerella sp.]
MKTIFLILAAGIIFSLPSCNSNSLETNPPGHGEEPPPKQPNSEEPGDPDDEQKIPYRHISLLMDITVNDIKSFNTTTGQIVFTDLIFEKFAMSYKTMEVIDDRVYRYFYYDSLSLYYNDKPLFEGIRITGMEMSFVINDLVLIYHPNVYNKNEAEYLDLDPNVYRYDNDRGLLIEPKYYLVDGYPIIEEGATVNYYLEEGIRLGRDDIQRLRDESFKKYQAEWDIFIKYLRDAGKIVE